MKTLPDLGCRARRRFAFTLQSWTAIRRQGTLHPMQRKSLPGEALEATTQRRGGVLDAEHIQRDQAARVIQRMYKSRKARALLKLFPDLDELRNIYIDEKAAAAGADKSELYTPTALRQRETLRRSEEVADFCEEAWVGIMQAATHWASQKAHEQAIADGLPKQGDALAAQARSRLEFGMTREAYHVMSRKLYLIGKLMDDDDDIDERDMFETAEEDWHDDAQGSDIVGEDGFKRCWFQLVDLHTNNMNLREYQQWHRETLDLLTVVDPKTGTRVYREDMYYFSLFAPREDKASQRAFNERMKLWGAIFEPPPLSMAEAARLAMQRARAAARAAQADGSGPRERAAFSAGGTGKSQRTARGQMGEQIDYYAQEAYVDPVRNFTRGAGGFPLKKPKKTPLALKFKALVRVASLTGGALSPKRKRRTLPRRQRLHASLLARFGLAEAYTRHDRDGIKFEAFAMNSPCPPGHMHHFLAALGSTELMNYKSTIAAEMARKQLDQIEKLQQLQGSRPESPKAIEAIDPGKRRYTHRPSEVTVRRPRPSSAAAVSGLPRQQQDQSQAKEAISALEAARMPTLEAARRLYYSNDFSEPVTASVEASSSVRSSRPNSAARRPPPTAAAPPTLEERRLAIDELRMAGLMMGRSSMSLSRRGSDASTVAPLQRPASPASSVRPPSGMHVAQSTLEAALVAAGAPVAEAGLQAAQVGDIASRASTPPPPSMQIAPFTPTPWGNSASTPSLLSRLQGDASSAFLTSIPSEVPEPPQTHSGLRRAVALQRAALGKHLDLSGQHSSPFTPSGHNAFALSYARPFSFA